MQRGKTGKYELRKWLPVWVVLSVWVTAMTGTAQAKSVYLLANTNAQEAPVQAYDIQGDQVVYQQTVDTNFGWGSVGLAIDTDSKTLFVTRESFGTVQLLDAETFENLGVVTAPQASNLAGIVVDQKKQKIYAVDRGTNKLYVYFWDSATKTLTLEGASYKQLEYSGAYGLALDETQDVLYVTYYSNTIHYYETGTWTHQGSFAVSHSAAGIAVDVTNGYLYTGAWYGGTSLSKYNLDTSEESTLDIGYGVVGLAVDPATRLLYITTFNDDLRVYDCSTSSFTMTDSSREYLGDMDRDPAGICVPAGEVGYEEPISIFTVYPNPFKPNDQDADTGSWNTGVTFLNLAEGTAVRIYTLSGELVRDSGAIDDGEWVWDGCNAAGTRVASGMYIYVAIYNYDGKQKTGKIIVIR